MVFQIPEGLAPETYPMAWLVGSWRGAGLIDYEGIETAAYVHELAIDNDDDGPYLRVSSRVWLADEDPAVLDKEERGDVAYARLTKASPWSSVTGYLRAAPGVDQRDGATILEAVTSNPAGHAITWAGLIKGPQLQMAADAIAATPTSATFEGARLMAGLVESDLFVAYDIAAFGHELASYMAGRLTRVGRG
ncbi:MAG: FABP family protein [Actinomycetaceae bacterium]|nr:FABP family protein [Actinomycetaceae bacterium]